METFCSRLRNTPHHFISKNIQILIGAKSLGRGLRHFIYRTVTPWLLGRGNCGILNALVSKSYLLSRIIFWPYSFSFISNGYRIPHQSGNLMNSDRDKYPACKTFPTVWKVLLFGIAYLNVASLVRKIRAMMPKQFFPIRINRKVTLEIICCLLILLFIYAATSKLIDYELFTVQISKSPFIDSLASFIAWFIPGIEILIGISITFYKTRLIGLYGSLFLMTMFSAYIYFMLHYSYYLPCSCGGILSKLGWKEHLWFNIGFVILSIIAILLMPHLNTKDIPKKLHLKTEYANIETAKTI